MVSDLIVIVDPNYGEGLDRAPQFAPLWIVDTPINKEACKRYWNSHPHRDHREQGAVTSYKTVNPQDRLGGLLEIIPQLQDHHGEVRDNTLVFPGNFILEVIGLPLSEQVQNALREAGFVNFVETSEGFQARKEDKPQAGNS